ncbi:hypothetical protein Kisp01_06640 [Kineosporia sp. NBRC 101677]|nr:hypothetical protein Kisp01_06640 [Kineosporia sp. NBRC 101677]
MSALRGLGRTLSGALGTHFGTRRIKRYVNAYEESIQHRFFAIREATPPSHINQALVRMHVTADQVSLRAAGRLAPPAHLEAANLGLFLLARQWGTGYLPVRATVHDQLWRRSFLLTYSEALEWFTAARNRGELDEPMTELQWRAISHAIAASEAAALPLSYDKEFALPRVARLKAEAIERVTQQHSAATATSIERRVPHQQVAVANDRRMHMA